MDGYLWIYDFVLDVVGWCVWCVYGVDVRGYGGCVGCFVVFGGCCGGVDCVWICF